MHKVDSSGNVDGSWTDGDPVSGGLATALQAKWHNMIQEELIAVGEASEIVLDDADNTQLLQALQAGFGLFKLTTTADGHYFQLPGVPKLTVQLIEPLVPAQSHDYYNWPIPFENEVLWANANIRNGELNLAGGYPGEHDVNQIRLVNNHTAAVYMPAIGIGY